MKCPYCLEEIIDGAKVCRFCGKDQAADTPPRRGKLILALILVPLLLFFVIELARSSGPPQAPPVMDAKASCEKQFGPGPSANDCTLALAVKQEEDLRQSQLRQAAKDAGVR